MTLIALAVALPVLLYVALSLGFVQDFLRRQCESALSEKLGAEVVIGDLGVKPFNRLSLRDVAIVCDGDTIATASQLGAGIDIPASLKGTLTLKHLSIIRLDLRLSRDSADAPLNIAPIIAALSKSDTSGSAVALRINSLIVRESSATYDITSAPRAAPGRFDKNHIAITGLQADVNIPMIDGNDIAADIRRLSFAERSGFRVDDLHGRVETTTGGVKWSGVALEMPGSKLLLADGAIGLPQMLAAMRSGDGDASLMELALLAGSHIRMADVAPFAQLPRECDDMTVFLDLRAALGRHKIDITRFYATQAEGGFSILADSAVIMHPRTPEELTFDFPEIRIAATPELFHALHSMKLIDTRVLELASDVKATASLSGDANSARLRCSAFTGAGDMDVEAELHRTAPRAYAFNGHILSSRLALSRLTGNPQFGPLNAAATFGGKIAGRRLSVSAEADVVDFTYGRSEFRRIQLSGDYTPENLAADIEFTMADGATFSADLTADRLPSGLPSTLDAIVNLNGISPYDLSLTHRFEGYSLSGDITASITDTSLSHPIGNINMRSLSLTSPDNRAVAIDSLDITASPGLITLSSDYADGSLSGQFDFATLPTDIFDTATAAFMAALMNIDTTSGFDFAALNADPDDSEVTNDNVPSSSNCFDFSITVRPAIDITEFFGGNMTPIYPVVIGGRVDSPNTYAELYVDAPYIGNNKGKIIEGTRLDVVLKGGEPEESHITACTSMPTADGMMDLSLHAEPRASGGIESLLKWKINRSADYSGTLSLLTYMGEADDTGASGLINNLQPSMVTFNGDTWLVNPATITVMPQGRIALDNVGGRRTDQSITLSGIVSASPDDVLTAEVSRLDLNDIFSALNIDKVMLCGKATGVITASALLSDAPRIVTDGVDVEDVGYNRTPFGTGLVRSHWDNDTRAVIIDADITGYEGRKSGILAEIYAFNDSLDLKIDADSVQLGFLNPFLSAFASDVSGRGSGNGHLWGTFHDIDMEGCFVAHPFNMRVNYTNVMYTASDTIFLRPGRLSIPDVTVYDEFGHSGHLDGYVTYEHFRNASMEFHIDDIRDVLVYDQPFTPDMNWYGRVFGSGTVDIVGNPQATEVSIEATTSPDSKFTFIVSKDEVADDYDFLTFRDVTPRPATEVVAVDERMLLVDEYRRRGAKGDGNNGGDSRFTLTMLLDITPQAEIDVVLDPVAGDRIASNGSANLRFVYDSVDNDVMMVGTYTLERGTYNFTLQDIVIRDFTIEKGSTLSFTGNPLDAILDLRAIYTIRGAALSDLDQSFLTDGDLNRANVPVNAILIVKGDIDHPEISFDLAFPTLTSDIDRKVRSIISTDEMMNQQIIHLLVLNRFYTPDYMEATSGSELFSVASSTITSQISNFLSHLTDKVAISPEVRSNRGDFSDMEFDVALSSRLLNNRLLLNGNVGYRDNALSSNRFIGDVDVEYLLTPAGTVRLKAYNHFNDESYYSLRPADTTQGVGIVFMHDFDRIFRRRHVAPADSAAVAADTVTVVADSAAVAADTVIQNNIMQLLPENPADTLPAKRQTEHQSDTAVKTTGL